MRWFRFYSEALDDPKVQRLPGDLFKSWVNLLCLANDGTPRGTLPSIEDIGFRLRLSPAKTRAIIGELVSRGLLDEVDGNVTPHNWNDRQAKSDNVAERVQKHRAKQATPVTRNVTVTPQIENRVDTETEQSTEDVARDRAVAPDSPHGMCLVFLDAMGKTDKDVAPAWFDENRAHTKDMLEQGITDDQLRRFVAYERSRGKDALRLRYVKKDILDWEASGEPERTGTQADAATRNGHKPGPYSDPRAEQPTTSGVRYRVPRAAV